MEESIKVKEKEPKKTFRLINYENKYKEEREISDLLIESLFGKSRKELGLETLDQLNAYLKISKSSESEYFLTRPRFDAEDIGSCSTTIDNRKDPYPAAALGICDLIVSRLLPESQAAKKLLSMLGSDSASGSPGTLLGWISNKGPEDRQKLIAPLIRTLAVDYIQEHYHPIYQAAYEFSLQSGYYYHKNFPTQEEMYQVSHDIKIKFSEYDTWRELQYWWNSNGKTHYFEQMKQGDNHQSWWESEIEMSALESMFKIKIHIEIETKNNFFSPTTALTHTLLDDQFTVEEKEQLCILRICDKFSDAYYLRLRSPSAIKKSLKKLDAAKYNSARESIELYNKVKETHDSYKLHFKVQPFIARGLVKRLDIFTYNFIRIDDAFRVLTPALSEKSRLYLRENKTIMIKIMSDSVSPPFTPDEVYRLKYKQIISSDKTQKRYLILGTDQGIDEIGLAKRLKGFPEAFERLCECLRVDALEFCLKYDGNNWKYYRKLQYRAEKERRVKSNFAEIQFDEIERKIAIALQKNKLFQALEYFILGMQQDKNFFSQSRNLPVQQTWNIFILTWENQERENEFLEAINEMTTDHLLVRNVNITECIAIFTDPWPLKEFLKSNDQHIKYVKRGVCTLSVLTFINRYDLMTLLQDSNSIASHKSEFVMEAMIIAAEYNKNESLTYLEREYNKIHRINKRGEGALCLAVKYGFKNAVRYFFQRGVLVDLNDELSQIPNNFQSPFVQAAAKNDFDIIQYFVKHARDKISTKTIARSIEITQSLDIIRYLLPYIEGKEIVHECIENSIVEKNDVDLLRLLLGYIASSVNYLPLCNEIFVKALTRGNLDIIMLCVNDLGMNPNTKVDCRIPSLIYACSRRYTEVVRFLIRVGVDPNQSVDNMIDGKFYSRPIICALQDDQLPMVKCIIEESMARSIALKHDDLTQKQLELFARIQHEVEMEHRFKVSAAVAGQGPSFLDDGQRACPPEHLFSEDSDLVEQRVSSLSK